MATQPCPACKASSFTWSFNEKDTPSTSWGCYLCGYLAYEDESFERHCSACGEKTECRLEDDQEKYWWCNSCGNITSISE